MKAKIAAVSRSTGRTQSQICEQLIMQGLRDQWILEEIEKLVRR